MNAPAVATVHTSAPVDSIDLRHVAHLDQVEITFWSRGRLVQVVSMPTENAETLAGQLHNCVRAGLAELETEVTADGPT